MSKLTIANFLDRETRRIDALIEEKNRFIELLKEKRLALISHAVTKGLDPTVKMKDSGVEWLGEVPEHWKVTPLKHQCLLLKDGTHLPPPRVDAGIPLLSVRNIDDGRFIFRDDDSMISEENYQILCKAFVPVQNDDASCCGRRNARKNGIGSIRFWKVSHPALVLLYFGQR